MVAHVYEHVAYAGDLHFGLEAGAVNVVCFVGYGMII